MNRGIHRQLAEERGVDIRNPSTAFLGVDSADRYTNLIQQGNTSTTPYDVNLSASQNYLNGFFTRLALTEVKFPWAIPTITTRNNKIGLVTTIGGISTLWTIALAPKWYTCASLALALQIVIRATGSPSDYLDNFVVSFETGITNGFIAQPAASSITSFYFQPYIYPGQPLRTGLFEMMAWSFPGANFTTPSPYPAITTTAYSGVPTMLSTQYVDFVSSQLTYNQDVKDSSTANYPRDVLCRLYLANDGLQTLDYDLGSVPFSIYRNFNFPKQIKWDPRQPVGQILIQVYDDAGYILTADPANVAGDGLLPDWQFSLLVTEV